MRQAAQGAVHASNENMLTYQCTTLGATEVFPCLCTTVEVAGPEVWKICESFLPQSAFSFVADRVVR